MTETFPADPIVVPRRRLAALALAVLAAAAVVVGVGSEAEALDDAFFPTISRGNRGEDVRTMQLLLRRRGYEAPTTGRFDGDTVAVVRQFQSDRGLNVDGIVGARTWVKLVVRTERGQEGPHVLALQRLLTRKHGYEAALDGSYGEKTEESVIDFKGHMRLSANGIVGREAWRNLLWHFMTVRDDRKTCVLDSDAAWGASTTVGALRRAAIRFYRTGSGGIGTGHLSYMHGGPIAPHVSHQEGMDADLRPIRDDGTQCSVGVSWRDTAYDRKATRALIEELYRASGNKILVIWFNDPRLVREGLTESLSGHDSHLHVRWCVQSHPDDHYECENRDWYRSPSAASSHGLVEDGTEDGLYGPSEAA